MRDPIASQPGLCCSDLEPRAGSRSSTALTDSASLGDEK